MDTDQQRPQLYLITPPVFDPGSFPDQLAAVLDAQPVACLRLALATRDEDELSRAADALREVAHARDVALVIERHVLLAARLGLDGVHLTEAGRGYRAARAELGDDAIVGAFCAASRHDGLTVAEAGADYVSFGPVSGALGDGTTAPLELFQWWSEMIEIPVVAEGGLTPELLPALAEACDFLGFGDEIWSEDDPAAALNRLVALY
ncbi:thiamine phosphate synthase [Frigidibacter sp. ROC022]|uniref:thiamine phosphate synthase n=1 Tax=Frigidibacter sp. ROC022 TaxID=2971796 RepID=UPI00215A829B|nr:thiamine phosphate synthase [Frigidibacter sp. ROC022]MCR8723933.1 thiamine phosphate synthase [Frigidibacter sp. ROC022]